MYRNVNNNDDDTNFDGPNGFDKIQSHRIQMNMYIDRDKTATCRQPTHIQSSAVPTQNRLNFNSIIIIWNVSNTKRDWNCVFSMQEAQNNSMFLLVYMEATSVSSSVYVFMCLCLCGFLCEQALPRSFAHTSGHFLILVWWHRAKSMKCYANA